MSLGRYWSEPWSSQHLHCWPQPLPLASIMFVSKALFNLKDILVLLLLFSHYFVIVMSVPSCPIICRRRRLLPPRQTSPCSDKKMTESAKIRTVNITPTFIPPISSRIGRDWHLPHQFVPVGAASKFCVSPSVNSFRITVSPDLMSNATLFF